MELSPKAIRFLIDAVGHDQTDHEERLQDEHLTEEEVAALTNDHQYLKALKTDLKHYHDGLMCKGLSLTKGGGMDLAQANKATTLADLFAGWVDVSGAKAKNDCPRTVERSIRTAPERKGGLGIYDSLWYQWTWPMPRRW